MSASREGWGGGFDEPRGMDFRGLSDPPPWAGQLVPWKLFHLGLADGTGFWHFPTFEGLGWVQASTFPSPKCRVTFLSPQPCTSRDLGQSLGREGEFSGLGDMAAPP